MKPNLIPPVLVRYGDVTIILTDEFIVINNISFTLQELLDLDHTVTHTKVKFLRADVPTNFYKHVEGIINMYKHHLEVISDYEIYKNNS